MTTQESQPGQDPIRVTPGNIYQPVAFVHPTNVPAAIAGAEIQIAARLRNPVPAYLLCIFLGTLGLHRFYLRRNGSALAMLLITVLTLTAGTLITAPWAIVDLFLIPRIIREENAAVRRDAYGQADTTDDGTNESAPPSVMLHRQRVSAAQRALRGDEPWTPVLTRPDVLADAVAHELARYGHTLDEIVGTLRKAGLWQTP